MGRGDGNGSSGVAPGVAGAAPAARCVAALDRGGALVCRFRVADGSAGPWEVSADGAPGVAAMTVGTLGEGAGGTVVSAAVPRDAREVVLRGGDGAVLCTVTAEELGRLHAERDSRMVNPAIDGLYGEWLARHPVGDPDPMPADGPLFSVVVPLFETPVPFFHEMAASVLAQTYGRWELVLVNASPRDTALAEAVASLDDPRVRVVTMGENLGIAGNTNAGVAAATGDYVCFLDHDDALDPHLLAHYAAAVADDPECDLLYCDEDNFETVEGGYFAPRFKPGLDLDLLCTFNYVVHCLCVSRRVLELTERSDASLDGAQDYDLTFKAAEVARSVRHVPLVLYHWRQHAGSTNGGIMEGKPYAIEAGARAIRGHLARVGVEATVEADDIPCVYDVGYRRDPAHTLSAVVPVADAALMPHAQALAARLGAMGAVGEVAIAVPAALRGRADDGPWTVVAVGGEDPSFGDLVDAGASAAAGYGLLVLAPEVSAVSEGAVDALAGYLERADVGVVAPRVLRPDGLVGSVGLSVEGGAVTVVDSGFEPFMGGGYLALAQFPAQWGAVGPQAFAMRRDLLERVGGLGGWRDPWLAAADLSLRLRGEGLCCVCAATADVTAPGPVFDVAGPYTVGSGEEATRFAGRWGSVPDPFSSPNMTFAGGYPHLVVDWDPAAPQPRRTGTGAVARSLASLWRAVRRRG